MLHVVIAYKFNMHLNAQVEEEKQDEEETDESS
jgi:hypothetical protein